MPKNLLIVESPAKAKTIERFLGKDFTVKSSYGHVRDLDKGNKGVNIEKEFQPKYIVSPDKKKVVSELKKLVSKVDEVWLATDEDREGEAISWHLCKVLGLDELKTKRIVFREITKPAIQKAIESPRNLDINLVDAQQARRILDRLVGFELSEVLWKKIKNKLSAGRVQSVALKLLVEKEKSIQKFIAKPTYRLLGDFNVLDSKGRSILLNSEHPNRIETDDEASSFIQNSQGAEFTIKGISVKPSLRRPAAPFITSTLQQEASRKLGFTVNRTMGTAQKLYEQGLITYMRTDSTYLSNTAIEAISGQIIDDYGERYLKNRSYKSKNNLAQEAHEAIRPSYFDRKSAGMNRDQEKLYELIWKRTVASQMSNAELERTIAEIEISKQPQYLLRAKGEVLKFDGFLKLYLEGKDEEDEQVGILPPLKVGQKLELVKLQAAQKYNKPPSRFTEATLVKNLEELGIGRPSTYAPTITKLMEESRGYAVKDTKEGIEMTVKLFTLLPNNSIEKTEGIEKVGGSSNRLFPTDMGILVADFLSEHFQKIMNYGFTAGIEKEFDQIASGERKWKSMLTTFYKPFHGTVENTLENVGRESGERILGKDPVSGNTVLVRMSRFGPVVQIGNQEEVEEGEKPRYANLRPGQSMNTIEIEDAMDLFKLPRNLGEYKGQGVEIGAGRYGPYVKYNGSFISLNKGSDPLSISMEEAIALIEEKIKADAPMGTYKGEPIRKGKGRFGPFLKWGDNLFVNIPKKYDPELITIDEAYILIEQKIVKEANRYIHQWPEAKITVENGRWGPFIRFKKKFVKLPKVDGEKPTSESAVSLTLEEVKKIIEAELPGSFKQKKNAKK